MQENPEGTRRVRLGLLRAAGLAYALRKLRRQRKAKKIMILAFSFLFPGILFSYNFRSKILNSWNFLE